MHNLTVAHQGVFYGVGQFGLNGVAAMSGVQANIIRQRFAKKPIGCAPSG